MIKNFVKKPNTVFNLTRHLSISLAVSSYFETEQSSNDYITSLCKQNLHREALEAFEVLRRTTRFRVNIGTYSRLICACSCLRSLEHARNVHEHIGSSNARTDVILNNHILNMYGKCGSLRDARRVFDEMPEKNVVSWTALIAGYSQNGRDADALELYVEMLKSGVSPDEFTFGSAVKACSGFGDLSLGRQLHAHVLKSGSGSQLIAQNALIAMYTKFDRVDLSWDVFFHIEDKDLISWASMIAGFCQLGHQLEGLRHFKNMMREDSFQPNEFIFGSAFSACSTVLEPEYGKQIHGLCIKFGFGRNNFSGCSLCDMYAKSGFLLSAVAAFHQIEKPDLVSWNVIIAGLANHGHWDKALLFFIQMRHLNMIPDETTARYLLCGFMSPSTLNQGMQIHSYIVKMGFHSDVQVGNILLTMYAKSSNLHDAFNAFEEVRKNENLVSWNAILSACMQHHEPMEVFRLFKLLLLSDMEPDYITLTTVIGAYAEIASLEMASQIHCYTIKLGMVQDVSVSNGLTDMYTKCGSLDTARSLFYDIEVPDVFSWSTLIVGYAQFGYAEEALKLYARMRSSGVKPDDVTFVGVLTACSHVGLVEEGWELYNSIETEHRIVPTREHCACMVDLLGRAGYLSEAKEFIQKLVHDPDIVVWKTLLAACKTYKDHEIGKWVAENILRLDPSNSAALVLLCRIYASSGNWEEVARLRGSMKEQGVRKVPGQSWIEVKNRMHAFLAQDNLHPERDRIYSVLEELWLHLLDHGYLVA
ncbi:hypothetical protein CRG98_047093 [Punica granatum]|uniref:Pentatricopeptide repeat-containing protein At3g53360, mitochondrial n=1 Tax=Punica granatum TaxID=22663 RepID=A0A2I0HLQ6_PUNGR|nr:hypothetical protein CRG98_047093 [Punica granatum]